MRPIDGFRIDGIAAVSSTSYYLALSKPATETSPAECVLATWHRGRTLPREGSSGFCSMPYVAGGAFYIARDLASLVGDDAAFKRVGGLVRLDNGDLVVCNDTSDDPGAPTTLVLIRQRPSPVSALFR